MKQRLNRLARLSLAAVVLAFVWQSSHASQKPSGVAAVRKSESKSKSKSKSKYVPVAEYDPRRDAAADIERAVAEAKRAKKNVLLEVGGKWCVWCRIMDAYFEANPDVLKLREDNYVTLKINFSPENENKEVIAKYGEVAGYPHIFVLDSKGKLIQSQGTGELEAGRSYDKEKFVGFLKKWSPTK
ncbi:MAG: thioredoxin family protein [Acidobacteria bacterium]|nr:thioredoxin family protein [Acidobacteriota bacterium]